MVANDLRDENSCTNWLFSSNFAHSYLPVFASCLPHISVAAAKLIWHQWLLIWHELDPQTSPCLIRIVARVDHPVRIFFFLSPSDILWQKLYEIISAVLMHSVIGLLMDGIRWEINFSALLETLWKPPRELPEEAPLWTFLGYKVLKRQKYWCQVLESLNLWYWSAHVTT